MGIRQYENSKLSVHLLPDEGQYILIHTQKELQSKFVESEITEKFGEPDSVLGTEEERFLIWEKQYAAFEFDVNQVLKSKFTWRKNG